TFDIDANGIVNVSAKDKATGKEQQIRIQASGGLSEEEIQQMLKDAEANAAEDKKRKELIEVKNQAETLVNTTEKGLADYGDKVSAEEKTKIEEDLNALKEALKGEDKESIQAKIQALMQSSMKIGEMMYKDMQEKQQGDAAQTQEQKPADDGVVDGDFKDLNK
ncbi:MAG: Hsp70 family protein, partial [Alphaproteobacteria bacterium]|nr:Hsp70 family protein [Alphaproteobacteria bacterium]